MPTEIMCFNGNPNVGLYCYANNNYCIVPLSFPNKIVEKIENTLKVPVYRINIAGTALVGVFLTGTDDLLLVPHIVFNRELESLKKFGIKYEIIDSELTALSNNILVGSEAVLINNEYNKKVEEKLSNLLNKKVVRVNLQNAKTVGSLLKVRGENAVVSPLLKDKEVNTIKKILSLRNIERTTINFGNPFISSGIVCNDKGLIVGCSTIGAELMIIEQTLGFLNK